MESKVELGQELQEKQSVIAEKSLEVSQNREKIALLIET